jgi:hypothetical protein
MAGWWKEVGRRSQSLMVIMTTMVLAMASVLAMLLIVVRVMIAMIIGIASMTIMMAAQIASAFLYRRSGRCRKSAPLGPFHVWRLCSIQLCCARPET